MKLSKDLVTKGAACMDGEAMEYLLQLSLLEALWLRDWESAYFLRSCHCLKSHRIKHRKKNDFSSFHFCLISHCAFCWQKLTRGTGLTRGAEYFQASVPQQSQQSMKGQDGVDIRQTTMGASFSKPIIAERANSSNFANLYHIYSCKILKFSLSCDFLCLLSHKWKVLCVSTVIL